MVGITAYGAYIPMLRLSLAAASGGSTERSKKGDARRTRSSVAPRVRRSSAST